MSRVRASGRIRPGRAKEGSFGARFVPTPEAVSRERWPRRPMPWRTASGSNAMGVTPPEQSLARCGVAIRAIACSLMRGGRVCPENRDRKQRTLDPAIEPFGTTAARVSLERIRRYQAKLTSFAPLTGEVPRDAIELDEASRLLLKANDRLPAAARVPTTRAPLKPRPRRSRPPRRAASRALALAPPARPAPRDPGSRRARRSPRSPTTRTPDRATD